MQSLPSQVVSLIVAPDVLHPLTYQYIPSGITKHQMISQHCTHTRPCQGRLFVDPFCFFVSMLLLLLKQNPESSFCTCIPRGTTIDALDSPARSVHQVNVLRSYQQAPFTVLNNAHAGKKSVVPWKNPFVTINSSRTHFNSV